MIESDVPFAGHGREVTRWTQYFGDRDALIIESTT